MKRTYDTQIPQKDFHNINRLISREGISYFKTEPPSVLNSEMINSVDPNIRILCHLLLPTDFKITGFYPGYIYNREELKALWNKIKREEKLIRTEGLLLKQFDGKIVNFKDPVYRTYWPSFEGFASDYKSNVSWLILDVLSTKKEQVVLMKEIIKSVGDLTSAIHSVVSIENDTFTFKVKARESNSISAEWRRLTEVLSKSILSHSKIGEA